MWEKFQYTVMEYYSGSCLGNSILLPYFMHAWLWQMSSVEEDLPQEYFTSVYFSPEICCIQEYHLTVKRGENNKAPSSHLLPTSSSSTIALLLTGLQDVSNNIFSWNHCCLAALGSWLFGLLADWLMLFPRAELFWPRKREREENVSK